MATLTEAEELKIAMRDIVGLSGTLALRVLVLEATIAEMVSAMPSHQASAFGSNLKARTAKMMKFHASRLMPGDEAAIARATSIVLKAATPVVSVPLAT